jgi:hypothetical protein
MWIASEFKPQFELAAKSWAKVEQDNRDQHFFAVLDFDASRDTFRRVSDRIYGGTKLETNVGFFYPAGIGICTSCVHVPCCQRPTPASQWQN